MHGIGLGTEKLTNKREKKKRPPRIHTYGNLHMAEMAI